MLDIHN